MKKYALLSILVSAILVACGGGPGDNNKSDNNNNNNNKPAACTPSIIGAQLSAATAFDAIKGKTFTPDVKNGENSCGATSTIQVAADGSAKVFKKDGSLDGTATAAEMQAVLSSTGWKQSDGKMLTWTVYKVTINSVEKLTVVEKEDNVVTGVYANP